jgi:predicted metal-dependent phosphotriesterase family hydrolase
VICGRVFLTAWVHRSIGGTGDSALQSLQQFGVNPAKAAIAHAQHMVAGAGSGFD